MSKKIINRRSISNPFVGAIAIGVGRAISTAIGAAIRENDVHSEALTVLAGGAITGAIAGLLGCCIPETDNNSSLFLKMAEGVLVTGISVAAILTAPIMGEECLQLGIDWGQVIVDSLIGDATITACVLAIGIVGGIGVGCVKGIGFFSGRTSTQNQIDNLTQATNIKGQPGYTATIV